MFWFKKKITNGFRTQTILLIKRILYQLNKLAHTKLLSKIHVWALFHLSKHGFALSTFLLLTFKKGMDAGWIIGLYWKNINCRKDILESCFVKKCECASMLLKFNLFNDKQWYFHRKEKESLVNPFQLYKVFWIERSKIDIKNDDDAIISFNKRNYFKWHEGFDCLSTTFKYRFRWSIQCL